VRIAVTGASGVLGRGLVARLLSQGHEVAGIARRQPESWPSAGDFVAADIRDADAVRRAVTGADVVVHCAWAPRDDGQVNIAGTANLLTAMSETGGKRIVFASSAHV
jgi:nucleoside-diphosphate-sugar epimerase